MTDSSDIEVAHGPADSRSRPGWCRADFRGPHGCVVRMQYMEALRTDNDQRQAPGDSLMAFMYLASQPYSPVASASVGSIVEHVILHAGTVDHDVCWLKFGSDLRGSMAILLEDRDRCVAWLRDRGARVFL